MRSILLFAALLAPFTFGAPTLDATTLLQNGKDAQTLNTEFQGLKSSDACNSGQMACIEGDLALCQFGSWKTQACTDTQRCFAVPSVTARGTNLICTSRATALSLIHAAGVQGGLTAGNATNATVAFPTASLSLTSTPVSSATSISAALSTTSLVNEGNGVQVITVTVTLSSAQPTLTLPPETRTLGTAEVSSLLSSLSANSFSIVSTSTPPLASTLLTSMPTPASSAPCSASRAIDSVSGSSGPSADGANRVVAQSSFPSATTIILTNRPVSAAPTATAAVSGGQSVNYKRAFVGGRRGLRRA